MKNTFPYPRFIADKLNKFSVRVQNVWAGGDILEGLTPDSQSVLLNHNDYLNLSSDEYVLDAIKEALDEAGSSQMMSAIFRNSDDLQSEFEDQMAEFLAVENVLLTQSGWNANVGLLQSVLGKGDICYIDMLAHTSIWQGAESSGAKIVPFRHNDLSHLQRKIKQYGAGLVCVDSVYSTNGDLCPIKEVLAICEENQCALLVDESHTLGLYGFEGRGLVHELGLSERVHFITASLSKAFCTRAGIITCSNEVKDMIVYNSLPAIFSSAVGDSDIKGAMAMIVRIAEVEERRQAIRKNADRLREGLLKLGFDVTDSKSQIISLKCGLEKEAILVRDFLNDLGIFGAIFAPPATAQKKSLLRFTVHSFLELEDIERTLSACQELAAQYGDLLSGLMREKDIRREAEDFSVIDEALVAIS